MSTARHLYDPVGDVGTDERSVNEFITMLRELLDGLPDDQRNVLVALANNIPLCDFAGFTLMTPRAARKLRTAALASLRAIAAHPDVAQYRDLELSRALLAAVRAEFTFVFKVAGEPRLGVVTEGQLTEELRFKADVFLRSCTECGHNVIPALARGVDGRGRRRVFCNNACRQRAYRRRRALQRWSENDLADTALAAATLRI